VWKERGCEDIGLDCWLSTKKNVTRSPKGNLVTQEQNQKDLPWGVRLMFLGGGGGRLVGNLRGLKFLVHRGGMSFLLNFGGLGGERE